MRLRVDASLEPTWTVTNDRNPDGKPISSRDREKLGMAQLGSYVDRHLTWEKGTIVSRFTGNTDDLTGILTEANRCARSALRGMDLIVRLLDP